MNIKWTQEETAFVRKWAHLKNDADLTLLLSEKFHRVFSMCGVKKYRQRLGIVKERGKRLS